MKTKKLSARWIVSGVDTSGMVSIIENAGIASGGNKFIEIGTIQAV